MNIMKSLINFLKNEKPLPPGVYHQRGAFDQGGHYRLHLRVEEGGTSILSVDASRILHLNQTATEYAKLIVEGKSRDEAIKAVRKRYRVDRETAESDYDRLMEVIDSLVHTEDICPISYLDVDRIEPFATPAHAPYRMDLALTYRCNNACGHCYVGRDRSVDELDTEAWREILRKLWDIGIFHVAFTGGEATMRDDLPELVGIAEDLGMVSGLLTNGRRLSDKKYLQRLIDEGIDYFQITLESSDKKIHNEMVCADAFDETVEGIRNAAASPIHTITNTTITSINAHTLEDTVAFVKSLGVDAFAMNGIIYTGEAAEGETAISEDDLQDILVRVNDAAHEHDLRFIWYTPTRYCRFNPMELDLGMKQCTAGRFNMCIEPNGDALPCQSYFEPVGNILKDRWEDVWNHPLLVGMRRRSFVMDECTDCDLFSLCGGGCPLERDHDRYICGESMSSP